MSREKQVQSWWRAVAVLALALTIGCSTDSPTAPDQEPPPPPSGPSATWIITVSTSPRELVANAPDPATITIRVRRADNGNSPPQGTTIVVQTTLGDLLSLNSGIQSAVTSLINGRAELLIFPGTVTGRALITAILEQSAGQTGLPIVAAIEPVVANFSFANTNDNLSVQFQNLSSGNPTSFRWDFGDGGTSTEENPNHVFPGPGDFVVTLTASKPGSSDSANQIISISEQDDEVVASFEATVDGLEVAFRDTSRGDPTTFSWDFGDGSGSSLQNPIHTYPGDGTYIVVLTASNASSSDSESLTLVLSRDLFIQLISPDNGPATGGNLVTITGSGFTSPLRVLFGAKLAVVNSVSSSTLVVTAPIGDLNTQVCDDDFDGISGLRSLDTPVDVTVELESGATETIGAGYTYLSPSTACVGD